jgi:hypothetical protein
LHGDGIRQRRISGHERMRSSSASREIEADCGAPAKRLNTSAFSVCAKVPLTESARDAADFHAASSDSLMVSPLTAVALWITLNCRLEVCSDKSRHNRQTGAYKLVAPSFRPLNSTACC